MTNQMILTKVKECRCRQCGFAMTGYLIYLSNSAPGLELCGGCMTWMIAAVASLGPYQTGSVCREDPSR